MITASKCSCIASEDEFIFTIDYKDKYLVYTDYSVWNTSTHSLPLDEYIITISNNGASKNFKVKVGLSTPIKYSDLPFLSSQDCIPNCNFDGIYTFQVETCGDIYSKTVSILQSLNCAYKKLLLEKRIDYAFELFKYIEYIKAYTDINANDSAKEIYKIAIKFINKLKCNCNGFM